MVSYSTSDKPAPPQPPVALPHRGGGPETVLPGCGDG